jgi:hypothetical protein
MEHCAAALRDRANGSADQVNVPLNLLQQLSEALPEGTKPQTLPGSYGAFVQLYQEYDEHGTCQLMGVLNATVPGHGKMLSRFLHIFPGEVTQSVRDWNRALQDEQSLFMENADASYFNANLHPSLLPYEVRMPGSHNSLPVEKQLPITDFEVLMDAASGEIRLLHKPTAKRACVFDLGFQGHGGRSQLFQLLDKFTGAEYLFVHPLVSAVNAASETKTELLAAHTAANSLGTRQIIVRPRIVYENKLVLQRKGWFVPREIIPQRQPGMSDWSYYAALNQWRKAQGIADEVFVTISPDRHQVDAEPERMKKLGRDDYKPQYIHFDDPLLVNLFEKLMAKVPITLKIVEMLPNSRQLLPINGQPFVTEFVVQWYLHEGGNQ